MPTALGRGSASLRPRDRPRDAGPGPGRELSSAQALKDKRIHAGHDAVKWPARSSRATHSDSASVLNQSRRAGRMYAAADSA